jgi:hypothetical protein
VALAADSLMSFAMHFATAAHSNANREGACNESISFTNENP